MKKLLILPLVIFTSPTFANSLSAEEMAIIQDQECQEKRKGGRYYKCDDKTIQERNNGLYFAITELKKIPVTDAKYEFSFSKHCGREEIFPIGKDRGFFSYLRDLASPAQKELIKKTMDETLNCPTYPTISNYDELSKLPMLSFSCILSKDEQCGNPQAFKEVIGVLKEEYGARINDDTFWPETGYYVRCSSVKNNLEKIYKEIDENYGKRAQELAEQEKEKFKNQFLENCSDTLKLTPKSYLKKHFENSSN